MLSPYAVQDDSAVEIRRKHPQSPHQYRSEFQRDRDRIIHSRAFRRLENKTQVFSHRYSDHFRNRLTHTIEVAQISRTVVDQLGLHADLAETLALAHDIGHPPFGHSGEHALDECMRRHGKSFDHNLHALRIVEHFEVRYPAYRGLNLTFAVREGIIKHSRDYAPQDFPLLAEYFLDQRPPLEAQLIDLTDEIAYNTADLDDGLESELLTIGQIREQLPFIDTFYREADKAYPAASAKLKFNEALKRVLDALVSDLIANTRKHIAARNIATLTDVRTATGRLAAFSPEVEAERKRIKQFLYENLYYCPELREDKEQGKQLIRELFDLWMERPETLPPAYQQQAKEHSLPRVVCDYIAGMTDNFVRQQHAIFLPQKQNAPASR